MLVRCKGYKTCDKKNNCKHSEIHHYDTIRCPVGEIDPSRCVCSSVYLRKEKLKRLNDTHNNK